MLRGFYTAASGLVTHEKRLNVHANNLANVSSAGFKKDGLIVGTFGEHMSVRMDAYQGKLAADIGPGVFMATTVDEFTDLSQGAFDPTGRPLDVCIQGPGYFVLRNAAGDFLTRDGQFALDDEGYLMLTGYGRVQGENGDIQIGSSFFTISGDGTIYLTPQGEDADPDAEPEELDRLLFLQPAEGVEIKKLNNGELITAEAYMRTDAVQGGERTLIRQGVLERSNVDVASEMTAIISTQRAFQSCSQIVKMYDEMADQANTRISRI